MGAEEIHKKQDMGVVILAWIVGIAVATVSTIYLILNIKLRNTRLIKMSSPNLNILVASGGILSSLTCVLFGVDYFLDDKQQLSSICQFRAATLSCSFTLLYGPLLAKCWRVYRIFEQASLKRVVIRDNKLFLFVCVLLAVDIVVMIIWQTIDPLHYSNVALISQTIGTEKVNLSTLAVTTVTTCTSVYTTTWVTLVQLVKAPVLLASLLLAWWTRDVMLPSMNDCRGIITSSMTVVFASTVVTSISSLYQDQPAVVTGSLILGVGVCSIVTTSMVFVPKLLLWWRNPEKAALRVSISARSSHNVNGITASDQFEDDVYTVVAENRSMKKSIEEKDAAITELQKHLASAQKKLMEISLDQEARQDSGLDIDLSSSSGHEDSDANTSGVSGNDPESPTKNVESPQRLLAVSLLVENEQDRQPSLKSFNSSASMMGYSKLCRLRDSIAEDLTLAKNASSDIKNSLYKDMDKVDKVAKKRSFRYESLRSRQELAGSIAKSYNLDDTGDTYSYVSTCVESSSNLQNYHRKASQFSSSESIEVLPNDKLYPENQRRKKLRKFSRQNKPVFTISNNQKIVQSAVVLSKRLDTDTYV